MKEIVAIIMAAALSGCASVTAGTSQTIAVATDPEGAHCTLTREGVEIGKILSTPGSVIVDKTKHDITVICEKEGYRKAHFLNQSGAEGMVVGNIILGGVVGWAIDSAAGADNKYTNPVRMTLLPVQK